MGRTPAVTAQDEFLEYLRSGRDEMNLLEHSISGADKKPDLTTRSLSFVTNERHPATGEAVERSWKVTFSAEYGRPTPKDDDVFVALLKVTQQGGLMDVVPAERLQKPQVHFSSYQLVRILGWPDNGASYQAIDDALNRIGGVWIVAKNYWYDNAEKEYVDRKFGIIDDVYLYERDKYHRALKKARAEGREKPLSWIRWSDVMAESFQAGYVRKLDIEVYRSLEHPIARKLYRYLGKQFWNRPKHRIDLQTLCHEKLGYQTRETRNARLREKIMPALEELEAKGIYGLTHQFDAGYGRCQVLFTSTRRTDKPRTATGCTVTQQLVALGIGPADAAAAVQRHAADRITEDIEHVEFEAKAGRIKTSKQGLLARMLQAETAWARPEGFVSSAERERRAADAAAKRSAQQLRSDREQAANDAKAAAERAEFDAFLKTFPSDAERQTFADEALQHEPFFRRQYADAVSQGNDERMKMYLELAMENRWKKSYRGAATPATTVQKSIRF